MNNAFQKLIILRSKMRTIFFEYRLKEMKLNLERANETLFLKSGV